MRSTFAVVAVLATAMTVGCNSSWQYAAIPNAGVSLPPMVQRHYSLERAATPGEPLEIGAGNQTVLVATRTHENPAKFEHRRTRSFVIVLDGPPAKGTYEVTPDNGRLVETGRFLPPRAPYEGIEGRIKIVSVSEDGVWADCAIRSILQGLDGEPVRVLRGLYRFEVGGDPMTLLRAGLRIGGALPAGEEPGE